ncbi:pathogenesis-related protein 1C-like [Arachis stenosperma]|uniref:pathogenesis-related protein 1C-like n=1 Tax=Arachis stenosperma TaxID=217475 RepID=UPI0025ABF085|nr:pathogenesis-related protein 1C-like [Arachis stenosperma]
MVIIIIISFVSILLPLCIVTAVQESPEEYLKGHNDARASVGVPPLKWDVKLAKEAQKLLNTLTQNCFKGNLEPIPDPYYGQNVVWNMASDHFTGANAVAKWVAHKKYYDHKSNSCIGGDCKCYIQVVWSNTTHVGCARVKCDKCQRRCTLVLCLYSPPGNVHGVRPY